MKTLELHPLPWNVVEAWSGADAESSWIVQDAIFDFVCGCDTEEMAQFIIESCVLRQGKK